MLHETDVKSSGSFYETPISMAISTIEEGRLLEVNEAFERLSGYKSDEVVGRTSIELCLWHDPRERRKMLELLETRRDVSAREFTLRGKGGECRPALFSCVIIEHNGEKRLLKMMHAITSQDKAQENLLASEEALRVIFNNAHDAIFIHELNGDIIDVNDKVLEMYGGERSRWISLSAGDRCFDADNSFYKVPDIWERVVAGENQFFEWQARRVDNNALFNVEVSLQRIDLNQRYAILATVRDISARKRMEEEIEILHTNLAAYVMELEAANIELEAFNYTVSHDLRSPLTGIRGYSHLLLEQRERLDDECLGYARQINAATEKMEQLIATLLDFSRLSRCEIRREEVDLTAIAELVAAECRMADPCRQVRFIFAEGVKVTGDPDLLNVVMENLLGNAWKFTAGQESALIEFGIEETGAGSAYFVRDNGPGFDMADADRLFRPFVRLPGTTDFAGHGIGLATIRRIIQHHGGSAWAAGEPGNGATFYFTL